MESERAGAGFDLASVDPASTPGFAGDKKAGAKQLEDNRGELDDLQERLYAESKFGGKRSVLLVLQAMDTAGKGGIVRHVVGSVDPQGVHLHAFKAPSDEEKTHDFLWRVRNELPRPGQLGVFDRSHYEDVLIQKVHRLAAPEVIEERYRLIEAFEKDIVASGTRIIKVMLHVSYAEQGRRLAERLDRPDKNWKYNPGDVDERAFWASYHDAYQTAIERTSTADAPWYVVPADKKWYARAAVQQLLLECLRSMGLAWPTVDYDVEVEKKRLAAT